MTPCKLGKFFINNIICYIINMNSNDYKSKKIKILRKPKFTKKKNPYKKY